MDYNLLRNKSDNLFTKHKDEYFNICQNQLGLKISEQDLSELLKLQYLPIYVALVSLYLKTEKTIFLGIAGVNGSGKSTLTQFLSNVLQNSGYNVVNFSMDDLYPTKQSRLVRANSIHPSLITRLMYDNEQVKRVFQGLNKWEGVIKIPKFDKAIDDRVAEEFWHSVTEKPDFVIIEGVFTFAKAIQNSNLSVEDQFLNSQVKELEATYDFIDIKLTLLTGSINNVIQFRKQQELELKKLRGNTAGMSTEEVESFIRYFQTYLERYTWPQEYNSHIDLVFTIDANRRIKHIYSPKNETKYL